MKHQLIACTASLDLTPSELSSSKPENRIRLQTLNRDDKSSNGDLTIRRNWMEFIEQQDSHPSAYDVLRCDLVFHDDIFSRDVSLDSDSPNIIIQQEPHIRIWGKNFHLDRLQISYQEILSQVSKSKHIPNLVNNEEDLSSAREQSEVIINNLISHMNTLLRSSSQFDVARAWSKFLDDNKQEVQRKVVPALSVVVTLLWTPVLPSQDSLKNHRKKILVRGHASCECRFYSPYSYPKPISATLALPSPTPQGNARTENDSLRIDDSSISSTLPPSKQQQLPNRSATPHVKTTSWSRTRKPLEHIQIFQKDNYCGEVLLCKILSNPFQHTSEECKICYALENIEVLEGLTSNFFAIYNDGTIRTAQSGVLFGYVRHLIIKYCKNVGLTLDETRSCRLSDVDDWVEVFISSSSRLIYPITKIFIPEYSLKNKNTKDRNEEVMEQSEVGEGEGVIESDFNSARLVEFWSSDRVNNQSVIWSSPRWEALFDELVNHGDGDG